MGYIEKTIAAIVLFLVLFIYSCLYTSAEIRQEIIYNKTGQHVSKWVALNYPKEYFTDSTIRIK